MTGSKLEQATEDLAKEKVKTGSLTSEFSSTKTELGSEKKVTGQLKAHVGTLTNVILTQTDTKSKMSSTT